MRVAIGCDPNARALKDYLVEHILKKFNYVYKDFGSKDQIYGRVAIKIAEQVAQGKFDRGILLCGTGIGVSIAANKVRGAYAALVSSTYAAEKAVTSTNANILCIGAFTTGQAIAEQILKVYLDTKYIEGTPSAKKIACYVQYDQKM